MRQGDDAVFSALAVVEVDGALAKIDVFDAEFQGLTLAESAATHEFAEEFSRIFEAGEETFWFPRDSRTVGALACGVEDEFEFADTVDLFCQESKCIERLLLGGRRDAAFEGDAGCQPAKPQRGTLRYRPARTKWPTPHRQPARN